MVSGRDELTDICARLTGLGVRTIFVPAGDADPPAGNYHSSLDLLEDLAALGNPFAEVGITGYPESHPSIADDLTVQAMWDKRRHATYVVSNLTFDPATLQKWIRRMRQRGITMPVFIGMPGPVDRTKLLMMATKIGVGESTRFLAKHRGTFARLAAPGGFTGERFLEKAVQGLDVTRRGHRRAAHLHVQPDRRDRALAAATCSRASAARSPRSADERGELALETDRAGVDDGQRQPEHARAASSASACSSASGSCASHTTRVYEPK